MTTVADEKKISDEDLGRVARVLHDVEERILKGSLDPNDLVRVLAHLTGKGKRAGNLVMYSNENCPQIDWRNPAKPKAKRGAEQSATFDEVAFYQTRPGLYVDPDLKRYVGLQVRATRGAKALKPPRLLLNNESEATMFGELGSPEHAQAIANACDLGQIAGKIEAQKNGEDGELLTDGKTNIFPVRGLDGALRVVDVFRYVGEWRVHCFPFRADGVWRAGRQVFSN